MAYTITQAKTDLQGILRGMSLSKVQDPNGLLSRAARDILLDVDLRETKRIAQVANALYDKVYDYAVPTDLNGIAVVDIRPQTDRMMADNFSQTYGKPFDLEKIVNTFTVQDNSGVKTIRISKETVAGILLHDMNSITANGTWAVGGAATNLQLDELYFVTGNGSLSFDATGSSVSYIENSTFTAVDLTDHGNLFVWVYLPTAANVTNVILRWGTDSSNYYHQTVTAAHPNNAFQDGWNLFRFDWSLATTVGSPTITSIGYARVTITHTATGTGYRVDNIIALLPSIYEIVYYSRYLFKSSAGVWKEIVESDADLVNLETESYNLFLYKSAELAFLNTQQSTVSRGTVLNVDSVNSSNQYRLALQRYKNKYKSEVLHPKQSYYKMPTNRRFLR